MLQAIVDCNFDGIIVANEEGRITLFSPVAQAIFGYSEEEALGQELGVLIFPSTGERHSEAITRYLEIGTPDKPGKLRADEEGQRKNGEVFPLAMSINEAWIGKERFFVGVFRDLTEQKKLEQEVLGTERMAAIGRVAAAISHDLRNPLSVISNAVYSLTMRLKDSDERIVRNLELIKRGVNICERFINELLDFLQPREPAVDAFGLNSLVADSIDRIVLPANSRVITHLATPEPMVSGDREALVHSFLNLILNAIQAMPKGSTLEITTREADSLAEVVFRDSGIGIPEGDLKRIFEPLFTTQPKGTGLGLALVNTVIEGHRGTISVESQVGKGTTFTIKLPILTRQAVEAPIG